MKKLNYKDIFFILVPVIIYLFITIFVLGPAYQDDSFITFIYADNLSRGRGLVYNVGEYVEGFSSPLYTILLGVINYVLQIDIPLLSIIISLLSGILAIALTYSVMVKALPDDRTIHFLSLSLFAFFPPFLAESMQGMETALYILLISAFIFIEMSDTVLPFLRYLLYFSIILTRPEGMFLLTGFFIIKTFFHKNKKEYLTRTALCLVIYFLLVVIRYLYFNDIFPNTFYAKTPFSLLLLKDGINANIIFFRKMLFLIIPVIALFIFNFKDVFRNKNYFVFAYPAIFYIAFNAYIGGGFKFTHRYDIFPAASYIVLYSLAIAKASHLIKKPLLKYALILLLISISIVYNHRSFRRAIGFHHARKVVTERQKEFAFYLRENYPSDTVMSTGQAGAIKYYTDWTNIDMLGLCDKHIARGKFDTRGLNLPGHLKGDGMYVLGRRPCIILFHSGLFSSGPLTGETIRERTLSGRRFGGWLSEVEIMQEESFWALYEFRTAPLSDFYAHYFYMAPNDVPSSSSHQ